MALSVTTSARSPSRAALCQAVFVPPGANPVKPRFLTSKPVMVPASSRCTKSALPRASRRHVPGEARIGQGSRGEALAPGGRRTFRPRAPRRTPPPPGLDPRRRAGTRRGPVGQGRAVPSHCRSSCRTEPSERVAPAPLLEVDDRAVVAIVSDREVGPVPVPILADDDLVVGRRVPEHVARDAALAPVALVAVAVDRVVDESECRS